MKEDLMHPSSEELFAYRDGELTPEKRAVLEAHVFGCSICRALIDQVSALEAELRQAPTAAPPGYLDRLSESVRGKIAAASKGSVGPVEAEAEAPRRAGRYIEEERGGRGGRAARLERGRVKEAPKLAWAAVVGTASAAVAVLVVVVILIRQGPYQPMLTRTPEQKPQPVAEGTSGGVEEKQAAKKELDEGGARDLRNENERKVAANAEPAPAAEAPAPSNITAPTPPAANEPINGKLKTDGDFKDQLANRADELAKRSREQAPLQGMASGDKAEGYREEVGSVAQKAAPRSATKNEAQVTEAAGYKTILDRYGLPPVWNERVTPSALANAEPDLRSYYMSGIAGNDSARVRLYLAEATRLRYAPGDTELYDEIRHHYQRVIELAGPDADVAKVARERLRSLEK